MINKTQKINNNKNLHNKKVKVLLSKLGLDVHNRGVITVAKLLRDSGMEVIYLGNALPEEILNIALQESVDIIGVSSLGGAHLTLGKDLIDLAIKKNLKDKFVFLIGGVFSIKDAEELKNIGFDEVFTAEVSSNRIIDTIYELLKNKGNNILKNNFID